MKQLSAAILCTAVLAACSSTPEQPATSASASMPSTASTGRDSRATPAQPAASSTAQAPDKSGLATASRPSKNSVYFDYDSSAVKDEFRSVVSDHARFLATERAPYVRVEGNTDERGSREYNLALGQQRAEAVKQSLTLLGVPANRIETISYGEEKPRSEEASEPAYAENRRADIVHASR